MYLNIYLKQIVSTKCLTLLKCNFNVLINFQKIGITLENKGTFMQEYFYTLSLIFQVSGEQNIM